VPFVVTSFQDRKADHTVVDCSAGKVGISDERQCYVENTGLSQNLRVQKWKDHGYLREFRQFLSNNHERVVVWNLVGMVGYATKRKVHIVENFALSEPLLARIRITPEGDWRPGHFFRQLPEGYVESLRTGQNVVKDPCLHALYDDIALATHAPLFDRRRWGALWRLNTRPSTCEPPVQKQR
jgi:arabinofuranosyltransferase